MPMLVLHQPQLNSVDVDNHNSSKYQTSFWRSTKDLWKTQRKNYGISDTRDRHTSRLAAVGMALAALLCCGEARFRHLNHRSFSPINYSSPLVLFFPVLMPDGPA